MHDVSNIEVVYPLILARILDPQSSARGNLKFLLVLKSIELLKSLK
jgi:hypothetical protein